MDIARYIGLFLLKNHFCYIHGLGNLEMKKKSAFHDGTSLNAPTYQVVITPGGSIDDTLANFIATNEQISISKAANALRDFSTHAKAELHEGREVIIPSLGKFVQENGKIHFITDPHIQYNPPGIPVLRNAVKQPEQTNQQQQSNNMQAETPKTDPYIDTPRSSINWSRVGVIAGLAVLVIICVVFVINYFNNQNRPAVIATPTTEEIKIDSAAAPQPEPPQPNSNAAVGSDGKMNYKILLQEYNTAAKAEKRVKTLTSYGYTVEYVPNADSTSFYVLLPISSMPADTTHVLDSIARILKPSGVSIYR